MTKLLLNSYSTLSNSFSDTTWIHLQIKISNSQFSPCGCNMATWVWPFCIDIHRNLWSLYHSPPQNQKSILKSFQCVSTILTRRTKGSLPGLYHVNSFCFSPIFSFSLPVLIFKNLNSLRVYYWNGYSFFF